MSYGMNMWDSAGVLNYSSTDVTWNQIDSFIAAAGVTVTKTYTTAVGLSEIITLQFMVQTLDPDTAAETHTVTVAGTTVTATPVGTQGTYSHTYVVVLGR